MGTSHLTLLTDLYELTMMQGYFKTIRMKKSSLMSFIVPTRRMQPTPSQRDWPRSLNILKDFILMMLTSIICGPPDFFMKTFLNI